MLCNLFNKPTIVKMLDFLLENTGDYSKTEISKFSRVSMPSVHEHWSILEEYSIVIPTRNLGASNMFKLNVDSPIVIQLKALDDVVSNIRK